MGDTVGSILRHKGHGVWSVSPDQSVLQAISLMADKNIGALVVIAGERLVGIMSERDYARKVVLQGKSSENTPVRDIMSSPVVSVGPNDTVDECMRIITARRIRHLPVVQGETVVGIISIGDLVRKVISTQEEIIQYLQEYIVGRCSVITEDDQQTGFSAGRRPA
jgi:CBS domain-containing protein